MRISACLIAKNEARCVARCINSFKYAVDEIILVDTGSTDNTVEIARSLGCKIFHFDWINDFAAARNYAIEQVHSDWILFLDCDEWFFERDGFKLRALTNKVHNNKNINSLGFFMSNLNVQDESVENMSYVTRLFRNIPNIRYRNPVHETLYYDDVPLTAEITAQEEISILHDGYASGTVQGKAARNLKILLKQEDTARDDPYIYYYIGREFSVINQYESAYFFLSKFIQTGFLFESIGMNHFLIATVIAINYKPGWIGKALLDLSMKDYAEHPTIHFLYSSLYLAADMLVEAHESQEYSERLYATFDSRTEYRLNLLEDKRNKLYDSLSYSYKIKGEPIVAAEYLLKSYMFVPFSNFFRDYILLLINEPADDVIRLLASLNKNENDLNNLLDTLRDIRADEVYLYFFSIKYRNIETIDYYAIVMFIIVGEYKLAYDSLLLRTEDRDSLTYFKKQVLCLLFINDIEMIRNAAINDHRIKRLLACYTGDTEPLSEDDIVIHAQILNELLIFKAEEDIVDKWMAIVEQYKVISYPKVANLLYDYRRFDRVAKYQEEYIDLLECDNKCQAIDYYNYGRYLYYSMQYERALDAFTKSIIKGYSAARNRIFITWILEKGSYTCSINTDLLKNYCYVRGDLDKSAEACEKALKFVTDYVVDYDAAWHYNLAEIYTAMNKPLQAEEHYRSAFDDKNFISIIAAGDNDKTSYDPKQVMPVSRVNECPICGGHGKDYVCVNMMKHYRFSKQLDQIRMWLKCDACGHLFVRDRYDNQVSYPYSAYISSKDDIDNERLYDEYMYVIMRASDVVEEGDGNDLLISANLDHGFFKMKNHVSAPYIDGYLSNLYSNNNNVEMNQTFHSIHVDDLLEHVFNPATVAKKVLDMVSDGGYIILNFLCTDTEFFNELVHRNIYLTDSAINNCFSRESIRTLFSNAGFEIKQIFDIPGYNGRACIVAQRV